MFCKYCGKEVQEDWVKCPYCGKEIKEEFIQGNYASEEYAVPVAGMNGKNGNTQKKKKPIYKRVWFWILIVIVGFIGFVGFAALDGSDPEETEKTETKETEEESTFAEMDFEALIGKSEKDLEEIGLKTDDNLRYLALNGDIEVSCTDGTIDLIKITGNADTTPAFHGVRLGMSETVIKEKLSDKYTEEREEINGKEYMNLDSGDAVNCQIEDGKVVTIMYTKLSEEELSELYRSLTADEYIFPDSDVRYLSEDEVKSVEADKLMIGRNEIFARHGYIFQDANLQQHFESTSWYEGTIPGDQFNMEEVFNDFEKKNVELIKSAENEINGIGIDQQEEEARIEAGKQEAINAAYNEVAGKRYHLKDAQRMIEFTTDGQFIYSVSSFEDSSCEYSFYADYGLHKDEMQYLVFLHIAGVDYYFRFFESGMIDLEGAGEFEGWYEPI